MSSSSFVRRAFPALILAVVLLASAGAHAAFAVTVRVDDDKAQCPSAGFRTISQALAFAPPGATIVVCPGRYVEQLHMDKPHVRVVGLTRNPASVVVQFRQVGLLFPQATVDMTAPATTLEAVTLAGRASIGVRIRNGAGPFSDASVVTNVRIRQSNDPELPLFQEGIEIGDLNVNSVGVPARAVVRDSDLQVSDNGIFAFGNTTASIHDNVIRGSNGVPPMEGTQPGTSFGITAGPDGTVTTIDIVHNEISGFNFFETARRLRSGGIVLVGRIRGRVGGDFDGNDIHDNGVGVFLLSTDANVTSNVVRHNQQDGIDATRGTGNRLIRNIAIHNAISDCVDGSTGAGTAGTANTWRDNIGKKSLPPGICRPPAP